MTRPRMYVFSFGLTLGATDVECCSGPSDVSDSIGRPNIIHNDN